MKDSKLRTKCPKCGSKEYSEYYEDMYDDGSDEPNISNKLIPVLVTDCRDCG
jgi:predicted nucleic-acid-binding Zn-ribbon protein